ncbi:hypothetical protein KSW27_01610, partial [Holdemanella biformis]|uniref:hypothetical protein n=1 Tax=Holdemanella biformis TaxID=1735 RepID=UPI001C27456B
TTGVNFLFLTSPIYMLTSIHAIAFSGLQETIQALEVFLNQKMRSKRIKEKNADHIIRKNNIKI